MIKRLLERGATDLERSLLSAGETEGPPVASARRAASVLGLGASVAFQAHAARAVTASQTSAAALRWAAWALVGAGGLLWLGHALRRGQMVEPPPDVLVQAPEPAQAPAPAAVDSTSEPPSVPSAETGLPRASVRSVPMPRSPAAPAVASAGSLHEEIARLDSARRALRAGDLRLALGELDRHETEFPRGLLGQEATLLRIEALARSGNRPAAEALAHQFLARQPNSPHAKRIESLLGQAERR